MFDVHQIQICHIMLVLSILLSSCPPPHFFLGLAYACLFMTIVYFDNAIGIEFGKNKESRCQKMISIHHQG